ncbi:pseudouridine synthase [bacterium 3DAC]|nr:rRNA pseudouridine synthase [Dictyoglomota bacterium]UZN23547.1 pseudouridine synthase [bacterium 3DAC]
MRLDKYLVWSGFGTRKGVKKNLIRKGAVTVNGKVVRDSSYKLQKGDVVEVSGEIVPWPTEHVYIMLNKPQGVITATEDDFHGTVMDLIDHPLVHKMFPVGRLDKNTEGLLIITTDGILGHRLISPKYRVEREYYVETEGKINEDMLRQAKEEGLVLEKSGTLMKVKDYDIIENEEDGAKLHMILTEGKYHEVKRIIGACGSRVSYLKRLRYGPLTLDEELEPGQWRELTEEEIEALKKAVGMAEEEEK